MCALSLVQCQLRRHRSGRRRRLCGFLVAVAHILARCCWCRSTRTRSGFANIGGACSAGSLFVGDSLPTATCSRRIREWAVSSTRSTGQEQRLVSIGAGTAAPFLQRVVARKVQAATSRFRGTLWLGLWNRACWALRGSTRLLGKELGDLGILLGSHGLITMPLLSPLRFARRLFGADTMDAKLFLEKVDQLLL